MEMVSPGPIRPTKSATGKYLIVQKHHGHKILGGRCARAFVDHHYQEKTWTRWATHETQGKIVRDLHQLDDDRIDKSWMNTMTGASKADLQEVKFAIRALTQQLSTESIANHKAKKTDPTTQAQKCRHCNEKGSNAHFYTCAESNNAQDRRTVEEILQQQLRDALQDISIIDATQKQIICNQRTPLLASGCWSAMATEGLDKDKKLRKLMMPYSNVGVPQIQR